MSEKEEDKKEETETGTGEGEGTNTNTSEGGNSNGENDEPFDKERALQTIRNQRKSENELKTTLAEANRKLKEIEDKDKSEIERLREENARLAEEHTQYEREKKERITLGAFEEAAKKAGAIHPTALFKLAENLEVDDDGTPKNMPDVLKALKASYPQLFTGTNGKVEAGAGKGEGSHGSSSFNDQIRRAAGRG